MRVSPQIRDSLHRFREQKRAYYSLIILSALFFLSLPAELLCNSKPLVIRYAGRWYFPVFVSYTERDFHGQRRVEPDYRSPRFLSMIGCSGTESTPQTMLRGRSDTGRPGENPTSILNDFDPEPQDVLRVQQDTARDPQSILRDFDPEPQDVAADADAFAILDDFDPEPHDGELARDEKDADERSTRDTACWMLWPPVPYDYAYISTRSASGRDALASPWGQTLAGNEQRIASSWVDQHYLGTDDRGRDVLARLVYGFRLSLLFGLLLALSGTIVGAILGAVQGFFGGWVDLAGQRVTEVWGSLPQLYLLMILSSLVARNISMLFVILNLTSWMGMAAYLRAEFLRGRHLDYVRAAKALGVSNRSIMFRHLLPNSMTPIITFFPFAVTGGILALVSLDFLGLGVPSPFPSLGELLAQGQANLHAIWIILPTFAVLSGTVMLLTFVGDGLRNAFDPRRFARRRKA